MVEEFDIVVIGAGQAGLAAGSFLRERGVAFALLEGHERVGDSWRKRYESLVLFSSRAYSGLPGIPLSGDPAGYPDKDEIADYLEQYAHVNQLPVRMNDRVAALERHTSGFLARTESGKEFKAASVIVATGPFQKSIVPKFADKLSREVAQFTGATYHRPGQLPSGRVLIVGDGATGRQLTAELAATHEVWLSAGGLRLIVPQRFLGRDIIAWFETTGALRDDKESLHGRFVQFFDPIPGWKLRLSVLRRAGAKIVQRVVDASDRTILFRNGKSQTFDAVIWAIGYHDDFIVAAYPRGGWPSRKLSGKSRHLSGARPLSHRAQLAEQSGFGVAHRCRPRCRGHRSARDRVCSIAQSERRAAA